MNADLLAEYIRLTGEKRGLDDKLASVKRGLEVIEAVLLEQFATDGLQSVKAADGTTAYLHSQLWARPLVEWPVAVAALRTAGLADLVEERCNLNTLSAWCREREKSGMPMPSEFAGVIETTETTRLRVRG